MSADDVVVSIKIIVLIIGDCYVHIVDYSLTSDTLNLFRVDES